MWYVGQGRSVLSRAIGFVPRRWFLEIGFVPRRRFRDELGLEPEDLLDMTALGHLTEGGFVTLDDQRLVATNAGRQRLNAVLAALLR